MRKICPSWSLALGDDGAEPKAEFPHDHARIEAAGAFTAVTEDPGEPGENSSSPSFCTAARVASARRSSLIEGPESTSSSQFL